MRKINKKRKAKKTPVVMFFVLLVLCVVAIIYLPTLQTDKLTYGQSSDNIPFTPVPAKSNLQLEWFLLPTTTPPISQTQQTSPTNPPTVSISVPQFSKNMTPPNQASCASYEDSGIPIPAGCTCPESALICKNGQASFLDSNGQVIQWNSGAGNFCGTDLAPTDGTYCIGKPVIYLYPQKPMYVNVQVITDGTIAVSVPLYPQGGWKNVLAYPNGVLQYQNKQYTELFYETSVNTFQKPQTGMTIKTDQLEETLGSLLDRLGLIGSEKKEFLAFWVPRLKALNSPYIYFSVLDKSAKAQADQVIISPRPDTQIDFIAYFKPEDEVEKDTLQLPSTPKRSGFVSVEWGGVIDR